MTHMTPRPALTSTTARMPRGARVFWACSSAIVVFAATCASYALGVSPIVGEGHYPLDASIAGIVPCGATTLPLAAIAGVGTRPSHVLMWVFLALLVIPTLAMAACGAIPTAFTVLVVGAFTVCAVASRLRMPHQLSCRLVKADTVESGTLAVSLVTLALLAAIVGGSGFNLDLAEVYTYRASATEKMPSLLLYLVHICTKVMLPAAFCLALHRRSIQRAVICLVTWIAFFGLAGHKAILAYPAVTFAAFILASHQRAPLLIMASLLALSVAGTADLLDFAAHGDASTANGWIGYSLLRGAIFQPTLLNYYYWEYFTRTSDFLYWAESRLTLGLVASPLTNRLVFVIGETYFHQPTMAANTGLIGSGFANAGLAGVGIYALVLGASFSWLNRLSSKLPSSVICGIAATPVLTILTGTDMPTALLTHGGLAAIVILAVLSPPKARHRWNATPSLHPT
jgi:hypothetical protein